MTDFWSQVLTNLSNVGIGLAIFAAAYIANMAFSLYYNIRIDRQAFDKTKLLSSAFKILVMLFGVTALVFAITAIVPWAEANKLPIPQEYSEVISVIATLAVCGSAACKYIMEAFTKMKKILLTKNESAVVEEKKEELALENSMEGKNNELSKL